MIKNIKISFDILFNTQIAVSLQPKHNDKEDERNKTEGNRAGGLGTYIRDRKQQGTMERRYHKRAVFTFLYTPIHSKYAK